MANRLFARRRDGRIEVRLNDAGRAIAREAFAHVIAAERDPEHDWHVTLHPPITPSSDLDDPLATLTRQSDTSSNAEVALASLAEQYLSDAQAWAWMCTLQVALRATATAHGILSDDRLESADAAVLSEIHTLQQFLFDLSTCL
ncbi:MAG TPA: hypothetical protein VGG21_04995 [Acidimicrobiales bacterium]|jgi:hypothetical protein